MNTQVSFEIINGKKVFQIFSEPINSEKKIVIMSHGFRGSSIGPARAFVDFESVLIKNGISVLRFDQPCSGNSAGNFIDSSFNEWISAIEYFATKYLSLGYQVSLLGQSMGATATMVASKNISLKSKLSCILLWVPDPKSTYINEGDIIAEENGQKYSESFWQEAHDSNFLQCIKDYEGLIHLVYGENDHYIDSTLRNQVIEIIKNKNMPYMILKGQDHSAWEYDIAQTVYLTELDLLVEAFL